MAKPMDEKTKAAWATTAMRMANEAARKCGVPNQAPKLETIVMIWPDTPKGKK